MLKNTSKFGIILLSLFLIACINPVLALYLPAPFDDTADEVESEGIDILHITRLGQNINITFQENIPDMSQIIVSIDIDGDNHRDYLVQIQADYIPNNVLYKMSTSTRWTTIGWSAEGTSENVAIVSDNSANITIPVGAYTVEITDRYFIWATSSPFFDAAPDITTPILSSGAAIKTAGNNYMFNVTYTDSDNDPPFYMYLKVGDIEYSMNKLDPLDNDYTNGVVYTYTLELKVGDNYCSFRTDDGTSENSLDYGNVKVLNTPVIVAVSVVGASSIAALILATQQRWAKMMAMFKKLFHR